MYREVLSHQPALGVRHELLTAAAARFDAKLDELTARSSERQREEIGGLAEGEAPALWHVSRQLWRESRRLQASHLLRGGELPETCPEPDKEAARLAAQGGLPQSQALKSYRIGHTCTMDAWIEAIEELDTPGAARARCVGLISRFITAYDDRLADLFAAEYDRQRERLAATGTRARLEVFRALIEGRPEGAAAVGYPIGHHHIGVVASGPQAERTLTRFARSIAHEHFLVSGEEGLVMGWFARANGGTTPKSLLRGLEPPARTTLAVGNQRPGHDGLRRTHREASGAYLVALRRPEPVVFYDDVMLEALGLRDLDIARTFIEDVLGSLDGADPHAERLRETLSAYFNAEQNAQSTASALGVHARTVRRRRDEIEARLGHQVNQRRAELEAALRLRSLLAADRPSI